MERIDLHTHTLASDGSDAPADVVRKAAALGLRAVAVTDHDTFAGLPEACAAGAACGIEVVPGVELSTVWGGEEVHLLGYFMDTEDTALRAAGGVPVVAHIFKYRFDDAQRAAMLSAAADAGALGVEVRYTTYTPEQTAAAQALAERFGLAPSGGSDYHGLRKPDIALGSGRGGLCVPYAWLAGLKALAGPGRV